MIRNYECLIVSSIPLPWHLFNWNCLTVKVIVNDFFYSLERQWRATNRKNDTKILQNFTENEHHKNKFFFFFSCNSWQVYSIYAWFQNRYIWTRYILLYFLFIANQGISSWAIKCSDDNTFDRKIISIYIYYSGSINHWFQSFSD